MSTAVSSDLMERPSCTSTPSNRWSRRAFDCSTTRRCVTDCDSKPRAECARAAIPTQIVYRPCSPGEDWLSPCRPCSRQLSWSSPYGNSGEPRLITWSPKLLSLSLAGLWRGVSFARAQPDQISLSELGRCRTWRCTWRDCLRWRGCRAGVPWAQDTLRYDGGCRVTVLAS